MDQQQPSQKWALKRHIMLVTSASLLCSSYIHARVCYLFHFFIFLWLRANCCSFLSLHLADKDGDILAAVKTRISVVSDAERGSDGPIGG